MNIKKHESDCRGAAWQLQYTVVSGERKYRALCLGCGEITDVTETDASMWNFAKDLITVRVPGYVEFR